MGRYWVRLALLVCGIVALAGSGDARGSDATPDRAASVTVNVYTCDAMHDPIDPNRTLVDECNLGTADLPFRLESLEPDGSTAMASTGSGGHPATIMFSELSPGRYRLSIGESSEIALSYIARCSSTVRSFDYPFEPFAIVEPGGRVNLELLPGESLECDWFDVLRAPATSLAVRVLSCDGDIIDPSLCEVVPSVTVTATDPASGMVETAVTDANGVASFTGSGERVLKAVTDLPDRVGCGFGSDAVTVDGIVTLDPDAPKQVDLYYCYPGA